MLELKGKYNTAKVFTHNVESGAIGQIIALLDQEFTKDSQIRIMPDTHAGVGCTIGTTMTITDKIVPNMVGVDIGCGMLTVKLKNKRIDLPALDSAIHKYVPSGFSVRESVHSFADEVDLEQLLCKKAVGIDRAYLSIGTLGGGNHFIEIDKDDDDNLYLVIHTGSRNLGKQVADYYQELAYQHCKAKNIEVQELIAALKAEGREREIQKQIKKIRPSEINRHLSYLEGGAFQDYMHDMKIAQHYADVNRNAIAKEILKRGKLSEDSRFTTVHNYIDLDENILRKGAISAQNNETVLIPMNMRDGSLICVGKGNADWNYSAPHGAGRLMSRSQAKQSITLSEFKKSMKGIYSTTIETGTIDESAFAYKPMEEIIDNIGETVEIVKIIKPVYNFKATGE